MNQKVFEQIEMELAYAEMKYPNQKLKLEKSIYLAISELSYDSPCCSDKCFIEDKCSRKNCNVCQAYAAIAILIRGLSEISEDKLIERERYMLRVLTGQLPK